jgi:hypothetical protein
MIIMRSAGAGSSATSLLPCTNHTSSGSALLCKVDPPCITFMNPIDSEKLLDVRRHSCYAAAVKVGVASCLPGVLVYQS